MSLVIGNNVYTLSGNAHMRSSIYREFYLDMFYVANEGLHISLNYIFMLSIDLANNVRRPLLL